MSRSNPVQNAPHPAERWFEWKGKNGTLEYYDKKQEKRVGVKLPFPFILLERTSAIIGFNKKAKARFYSNEIMDSRSEPFVVKVHGKGPGSGIFAEGFWSSIKDKVNAAGGQFGSNCYIAYKDGNGSKLTIGCIQIGGCAFGPWIDFEKENRTEVPSPSNPEQMVQVLYAKAIVVSKGELDKTGDNEFYPPVFALKDLSKESNDEAVELDKRLQKFFEGYFRKARVAQASAPEAGHAQPDPGAEEPTPEHDDVPF